MQMIAKWNRSQVSSNPLLLLLRTSRLNHGSLKHSEPTSQLVCSTLLEEKQSPFPLCTKNMRIWNEKSSIDGFQPCLPLSKLFYIKGKKAFFLLHFLRVHSFHSAWVGTTFIWQIFSCRAPTSAIITFHQIWSKMNQNNFLSDWQPLLWVFFYQDFALFHPLLLFLLLNPLLFLRLLFVPYSIQTCRNPRNGSLFCFIFSFITKYKYLWQMKVGAHQLEFCISLQIFLTENQHLDYSSAPWWTFVSPCPGMYSIWPTKFSLTDILFKFLIILVTELGHL